MKRKNLFKKFILGIFIFLFITPLFVQSVKAFETPNSSYQFQFEEAISSKEMNLQSFVNETLKAVVGSIVHFILVPLNCEQLEDCILNKNEVGLVPGAMTIMGGLYASPPASGVQYFADIGRDLGFIKPTYAQDATTFKGFEMMKVTQPLWKTFRNFAYILFVLILVGMGFAIMFRVKISPQAVITIQSALPKIVIALILITFSYAIVGLMLDLIVFLNRVIAGIFEGLFEAAAVKGIETQPGILYSLPEKFMDSVKTVGAALTPKALEGVMAPFSVAFAYSLMVIGLFNAVIFGSILIVPFTGGVPLIFNILFGLIVGILLLIALIKALWTLIRSLAMIVINLIFAPLRILFGTLPGNDGIASWFKDLLANAAVLPAMLAMFFVAHYLILAGTGGAIKALAEGFKSGQGITYASFWFASFFLFPLIGIFILLLIPKIADIIQSFITKKPFQYGTAIGEAIGPARMLGMVGYRYGAGSLAQKFERESISANTQKPTGWKATTAEVIRTTTGVRKS